jgi:hypothetical protein
LDKILGEEAKQILHVSYAEQKMNRQVADCSFLKDGLVNIFNLPMINQNTTSTRIKEW